MPQVLYLDCFSGVAGDMLLAALIDAGLPVDRLREALGSLGVEHEIEITRVLRAGLTATHFAVSPGPAHEHTHEHPHPHSHQHEHPHEHSHSHSHEHPHQHEHSHEHQHAHEHAHEPAHVSMSEIESKIQRSALSTAGKNRAVSLFERLAGVEAAIHGVPVERVHLHEVGAVDSIVDICGAVFALEWFGVDEIVASPLNVGGGTVRIAHGTFPVPAPATMRLLEGVPVYSDGTPAELVTPTGALLVSSYAARYGPMPSMTPRAVGYGAGTRDIPGRPNVLRVVVGERAASTAALSDDGVLKIECEIDDMSPQLFGPVVDRLLAAGALDVFVTAIQMKKGRPGHLLTTLAPAARRAALVDLLFRETTTIGVRLEPVARETLDRAWVEVAIEGGRVRIKVASRGGDVLNAAPEFDDCLRVADATGRPVKAIQAEALRAWAAREASIR